jgi:hypothetical protein
MISKRVRLALLIAFLCHGFFIFTARFRLSYDAYTHMLFANHYAESWFSLWETRWYAGFTVVSYPPLTHQLIALFIPILGFEAAYALVLWIVTSLYPLGIYAFCRIFTGKSAASYAALASAILLPVYVTAHIFGQLPFLTSTLLSLFGAASLNRYLREGGLHNLLLTVFLAATTMAAHHATLLFQPFLVLAVAINHLNIKYLAFTWSRFFSRFILFAMLAIGASILVIWPFWQWGIHQTMQTPIDHISRHNFFKDPLASAIFFWPLYGPLVFIIPFLFRRWSFRFAGLLAGFVILFLLGLGGTTSLPRLFFGNGWEWLTYDRFAFWACLTLTPFLGILFIQLKRRWRNRLISRGLHGAFRKNFISALIFSFFALTVLGAWLTPLVFPLQPNAINMQPIVDFLNQDDRSHWRYLTFGFGDQFAYLNLLTKATTIDGSYHTARMIPELRESSIGQVDTVYWALKGIPAIIPILKESGQYGVRWGFVNSQTVTTFKVPRGVIHRNLFIPVLKQLGWNKIRTLKNGVQVWENPMVVFPKESKPPTTSPITSFSWGVFPILAFVTTVVLGSLRIWHLQAEKVLRNVYAFIVGLIPLSMCFWFYRTIVEIPHDRVYFIYDNALFFLGDGLVLLAVIIWISTWSTQHDRLQIPTGVMKYKPHSLLSDFRFPLFAIFLLSSLSILWSTDWRTSLYISLHLWLVFLFILSLNDWREAWKPTMLGFCAALSIQVIAAFAEFASQSTVFLKPWHLTWPGPFDASLRSVSVVGLANGLRILRAYGTTPHPNILGGFVLISLLGPMSLFLTHKKPNYAALILFSLGIVVIVLTFSRSAWLGLMVSILLLIVKSRHLDRKRLFLLIATSLITLALTVYSLRDLVFTRISNAPVETEQLSILGRAWLNQQAWEIFRQHPLIGVGIGSFILELAGQASEGAPIEPVHNFFWLVGAELGIVGLITVGGLFIFIVFKMVKAQTTKSILASALLAGLGIISLFDHYLWSLAPGRLMLGLALGLWAGSMNDNGA